MALLIKQRRKQKGYSQVKLAAIAQVSLPTVQNLEAGKGNPTLDILEKIRIPLGISLSIRSNEPDWSFLNRYGLPLKMPAISDDHIPAFSYAYFVTELLLAIEYVEWVREERLREALAALLLTLQQHYPTFFGYSLAEPKVVCFLGLIKKTGRLIKLKRLALTKISEVL